MLPFFALVVAFSWRDTIHETGSFHYAENKNPDPNKEESEAGCYCYECWMSKSHDLETTYS